MVAHAHARKPRRPTPPSAAPRPSRSFVARSIEPKLQLAPASAPYERQADALADRVTRSPLSPSHATQPPTHSTLLRAPNPATAQPLPTPTPGFEHQLANLRRHGGDPLHPDTRQLMESRFGHSFDDVRVYTNPSAATLASDIQARAFTIDSDIVFARGRYQPHTPSGQHLLAHELMHTLQQTSPTLIHRAPANDDPTPHPPTPVIPSATPTPEARAFLEQLLALPSDERLERVEEIDDPAFLYQVDLALRTHDAQPEQFDELRALQQALWRQRKRIAQGEVTPQQIERRQARERRENLAQQVRAFESGEPGLLATPHALTPEQQFRRAQAQGLLTSIILGKARPPGLPENAEPVVDGGFVIAFTSDVRGGELYDVHDLAGRRVGSFVRGSAQQDFTIEELVLDLLALKGLLGLGRAAMVAALERRLAKQAIRRETRRQAVEEGAGFAAGATPEAFADALVTAEARLAAGRARTAGAQALEASAPKRVNVVRPSDLRGGKHAADRPLRDVISEAGKRLNKPGHPMHGRPLPQGRWSSSEAAQAAANRVDPSLGRQVVELQRGEGTVIHAGIRSYPPDPSAPRWLQLEADRALAIPQADGTIHIFPIDETHYLYGPPGAR